jgi:hypothetical protein
VITGWLITSDGQIAGGSNAFCSDRAIQGVTVN